MGWIARSLVVVALVVVAVLIVSSSRGSTEPIPVGANPRVLESEERLERSLAARRLEIASYRRLAWGCEDGLGEARTRAPSSVWTFPRSLGYRTWVRERWKATYQGCSERLAKRTIPATNDWRVAVALVQRIYPGTDRWLLSCSSGEGGHGGFVMNHQGSGASGWLQYMPGTFYGHVDAALADARGRGFRIDPAVRSIRHPLGQALTGAFMRTHGMSSHWSPAIDPLCR